MIQTETSRGAHEALARFVSDDLDAIATTHAASAAHGLAKRGDTVLCDVRMGKAQLDPTERGLPDDPIFDLASVTKPLVPVTLAMQAVSEGLISLDTPLREVLSDWDNGATFQQLLNHSSGLPAWYKYYLEHPLSHDTPEDWRTERAKVLARARGASKHPAGEVYAYSDLGYMTLMVVIEALFGEPLDRLANERIFAPLQMQRTRYVNLIEGDPPISEAVTTEVCPVRGPVTGIVHDENTMVLGGVSGHAGVFGTAHDLLRFCEALLSIDAGASSPLSISPEVLRAFWARETMAAAAGSHHLAGWDTPSGQRSSAGRGFPRETTVGHLGFTGTSVWMDRASGTIAILLTNRVHPTRENPLIFDMRVAFHEAIMPPS